MKREDTKAQFELDGRRMGINQDIRKSPFDEERDKAVWKLVRAIIEEEGGDASTVKEQIDGDYCRGIVRFKEVRVGEYVNGQMELKPAGVKLTNRTRRSWSRR